MSKVSNFLVTVIFSKLVLIFFSRNVTFCCFDVILALFLLTATFFFFSELVILFAHSLKISQNVLIQLSPRYKLCLFSISLNSQIICIEYLQGICFSIFVVEDFSGLFLQFGQCQHKLYTFHLISCID